MVQRFANIKRQSAEACAQNLVKAVESNKLGSVWLLDLGELSEIDMPILWKPTLIDKWLKVFKQYTSICKKFFLIKNVTSVFIRNSF